MSGPTDEQQRITARAFVGAGYREFGGADCGPGGREHGASGASGASCRADSGVEALSWVEQPQQRQAALERRACEAGCCASDAELAGEDGAQAGGSGGPQGGDAAACGAPGSCGGSCPGVLPGVWGVLVGCGAGRRSGCATVVRPSNTPPPGGGGASGSRAALRSLRDGDAGWVPVGRVGSGAIGSSSCMGGGVAASRAVSAGAASVCVVRGAGVSGGAGGAVRAGCGASAAGGRPYPGACGGPGAETGLRFGGRTQARRCRRRIG